MQTGQGGQEWEEKIKRLQEDAKAAVEAQQVERQQAELSQMGAAWVDAEKPVPIKVLCYNCMSYKPPVVCMWLL